MSLIQIDKNFIEQKYALKIPGEHYVTGSAMKMRTVKSSQMIAVGYHPDSRTLAILFDEETEYRYANVDQETYDAMIAAKSVGSFFYRNIKNSPGRYPYTKVERVPARKQIETPQEGGPVKRTHNTANEPIVHDVKCWPESFVPVYSKQKRFEIRRDDRGYDVGHFLRLHEWDPKHEQMTGRIAKLEITYVLRFNEMNVGLRNQLGLNPTMTPDDLVVLSLR